MLQFLLWIVPLGLLIFSLIDVITSDDYQVKHLPKLLWVFIIILLPLVGSIVWLAIGKDRGQPEQAVSFGDPRRHETRALPMSDTEAQIAALDREIAFHEKQLKLQRLEAELAKKKQPPSQP